MFAALAASTVATAQNTKPAEILTPSQAIANLRGLMNKRISVQGVLANQGRNYFTDRRLVLKDTAGSNESGLPVVVLVPLDAASSQGTERGAVPILADFLNNRVLVHGVIGEIVQKGVGKTIGLQADMISRAE